jgi:hypothetical protein
LDAQRIDDHTIPREELHKIHSAEGSSILVLSSAGETEVDALDLEGQASNVVPPKRQAEGGTVSFDQRNHQRGRCAEARARRSIDCRRNGNGVNSAAQEITYNAIVDSTMKEQTTVKGQFCRKRHDIILLNVVGRKTDAVIVTKA